MPLSDAEKAALVAAENDVAAADADVSAAASAVLAAAQDLSAKQASLMANTDALGQLIQALTPDTPAPSGGGSDPGGSSGGDPPPPPPPGTVTGLKAVVVDSTHIKVSWDEPAEPPTGYTAGRDGKEVGGGAPDWSGPIAGIATSITFGNLAQGYNYTFTITPDGGTAATVQASIPVPSSGGGGSTPPPATGGGTPASGTIPAPPAPVGRRLFLEDFSVAAGVGEYVAKYGGRGWNFYQGNGGSQDRDTGHAGIYSTYAVNKTFTVANNRLVVRQYVENGLGLGGVMRRGENLVKGSRFGVCLSSKIISGDGRGFKVVPCMGWPENEIWVNEIDGGENDDFSQPSKWKLFAGPDSNTDWYGPDNTGVHLADGKIHTIWWDWQDDFVGHIDDLAYPMGHTPSAPMQPLMQFEAWIGSGAVPAGSVVETTVYWAYADQA